MWRFLSGAHSKLDMKSDRILVKIFFFFGDHLILTKKPLQSALRLMKIWVKFVDCCFWLANPLQNPDFAAGWGAPAPCLF